MSKVKLAIIGNGMVGHRFIEDLLDKADASQFDITVFVKNPVKPTIAFTCLPTFRIILRKNCRWYVKVTTKSTALTFSLANVRLPSTAVRK